MKNRLLLSSALAVLACIPTFQTSAQARDRRLIPAQMHFGNYQKYQEYVQNLGKDVKPQPVRLERISLHAAGCLKNNGLQQYRLLLLYDACDQVIAALHYDSNITSFARFKAEFRKYLDLSKLDSKSKNLFRNS